MADHRHQRVVVHANYWLSGLAGHAHQAPPRPAARVDLPHPGPGQGRDRRRRAAAPGRRRGRGHRLLRRHPRLVHGRGRPARALLRRRPRPHRDRAARASTTPSSRPATSAAPATPSACARPAGAAVRRAHPAAEGPRRGRRARWPRSRRRRRRAGRRWAGRAAPTARPSWPGSTRWPTSLGRRATASASCRPQPHHLLSTYYRAADVCLVPSRSESFGLVALEAAACGTPVVAAAVGGLRTLVEDGAHGLPGRGPRPGRLRRRRRRAARPTRRWRRRHGRGGRRPGPGLHVVDRRRPAAPRSTPTSPPSAARCELLPGVDGPSASTDAEDRCDRRARRARAAHRRVARRAAGRRTRSWPPSTGASRASAAGSCGCGASRRTRSPIWFTLGQRTLHYETYVMPAPEENYEQFYEHLLRRNLKLFGAAFAIGAEDAVFLVGQLPVDAARRGRARPHPRLAVRLRRAVLPAGAAHRVRQPLRRLSTPIAFHVFSVLGWRRSVAGARSGKCGSRRPSGMLVRPWRAGPRSTQ